MAFALKDIKRFDDQMWEKYNIMLAFGLLPQVIFSLGLEQNCKKTCTTNGGVTVCETCIPKTVEDNINTVVVTNNLYQITVDMFSDDSWRFITSLNITEQSRNTTYFENNTFSNLTSLSYLRLLLSAKFFNYTQIEPSAFDNLDSVKHLNLSNCKRFSFDVS